MCTLSDKTIEAILKRGQIYEVGGAVRDRFLGSDIRVKDRDYLVTGIPYDDLTRILKSTGRVDLVGRSFGVIKYTEFRSQQHLTFDITLPRKEHSTGVGHRDFDVNFDPNLSVEDDLTRRDFTINAMAIAMGSGDLVDPLGGKVDLEKRTIRMTSERSFEEDPLRMLRAVQFAARFKFEIEPETFAAMARHAELINTVSNERIAEELTKLLTRAEEPSIGFRLMQRSGLLKLIIPELEMCVGVHQPGGFHAHDVFEHTMHCIDACEPDLRIRLAALFHDITKPQSKRPKEGGGATFYGHEVTGARIAKDVLKRLRFPHDLADDVALLVERHMFTTDVTDKGMRRLIRKVGQKLIFDLLDLRRADVVAQGMGGTTEDVDEFEANIRDELDRKPPFGLRDLALHGDDLMREFGLKESPAIGRILDHLLECVLDNPADNTPEKLKSLAKEYFHKHIERNNSDNLQGND